ncbi:hypothetical protein EJ08DRAFT_664250 [Tothia fuscella]|uniref:tRNA-intron lyase n=1 Tax=Tothia fuscella TaxID=1048955 RepID=A0A9P4NJC2_9PEZI|nr:hypothetical protein EJ08DRAFT_664250 [Tothia fuscella]
MANVTVPLKQAVTEPGKFTSTSIDANSSPISDLQVKTPVAEDVVPVISNDSDLSKGIDADALAKEDLRAPIHYTVPISSANFTNAADTIVDEIVDFEAYAHLFYPELDVKSKNIKASSSSPEDTDIDTLKEVAHPHQSHNDVNFNLVEPDTSWSELAATIPMHQPFPIFQVGHCYFVFDYMEAMLIRTKYHMVGTLVGTLPQATQQNIYNGVPLQLMNEEVRLLVEMAAAYIVDDDHRHQTMINRIQQIQREDLERRTVWLKQQNLQKAAKRNMDEANTIYAQAKARKALAEPNENAVSVERGSPNTAKLRRSFSNASSKFKVNARKDPVLLEETIEEVEPNAKESSNTIFSKLKRTMSSASSSMRRPSSGSYRAVSSSGSDVPSPLRRSSGRAIARQSIGAPIFQSSTNAKVHEGMGFRDSDAVSKPSDVQGPATADAAESNKIQASELSSDSEATMLYNEARNDCFTAQMIYSTYTGPNIPTTTDAAVGPYSYRTSSWSLRSINRFLEIHKSLSHDFVPPTFVKNPDPEDRFVNDVLGLQSVYSGAAKRFQVKRKPHDLLYTPVVSFRLAADHPAQDPPAPLPEVSKGYSVFVHLHSMGMYMVPGLRFGSMWMAYPGDPLRFHSHFLIDEIKWDEEFDSMKITGGGRLGTGVKKSYLIGGKPGNGRGYAYEALSDEEKNYQMEAEARYREGHVRGQGINAINVVDDSTFEVDHSVADIADSALNVEDAIAGIDTDDDGVDDDVETDVKNARFAFGLRRLSHARIFSFEWGNM